MEYNVCTEAFLFIFLDVSEFKKLLKNKMYCWYSLFYINRQKQTFFNNNPPHLMIFSYYFWPLLDSDSVFMGFSLKKCNQDMTEKDILQLTVLSGGQTMSCWNSELQFLDIFGDIDIPYLL